MKSGSELISEERQRQVDQEGWTQEHDDVFTKGQLALFGVSYALDVVAKNRNVPVDFQAMCSQYAGTFLPFDRRWWKPTLHPVRQLVKAGALIAAEIDRLNREIVKTGIKFTEEGGQTDV